MTIGLLKEIADIRPKNARLMGLDIGKKTIGVALSDPAQGLATPLKTINRTKFTKDILQIKEIVRDYEVEGFILGLPINMDESEGPRAQSIRDFALEFVRYPEIVGENPWVALWDERFSTITAQHYTQESDLSRRKAKDKGVLDKLAAQVILQSALDYMERN